MISPEARTLLFFSTVLILLLAKVAMLMVSGPMVMPDTGAYHSFAETILSDRSWITNADLAGGVEPPTAYRMVGYPALIALAIRLAGSGWGWVLASLQIVLSVLATARLFALRRPLGLGPHAMIFAVAAYATTEPLVLDPSLLTDSLNASLIILAVTAMTLAGTSDRHLRPLAALGSGLLLAAAFLL